MSIVVVGNADARISRDAVDLEMCYLTGGLSIVSQTFGSMCNPKHRNRAGHIDQLLMQLLPRVMAAAAASTSRSRTMTQLPWLQSTAEAALRLAPAATAPATRSTSVQQAPARGLIVLCTLDCTCSMLLIKSRTITYADPFDIAGRCLGGWGMLRCRVAEHMLTMRSAAAGPLVMATCTSASYPAIRCASLQDCSTGA